MVIDLMPTIDVVEEGVEVECGILVVSLLLKFDPCIITYTFKTQFCIIFAKCLGLGSKFCTMYWVQNVWEWVF